MDGWLRLKQKGEGRRQLHSRGGRAPFIQYKHFKITRLRTYSRAACPKLWGKNKNRKKPQSSVWCATAALSADILSVDAQPYCLSLGTSIGSADFVISTNSKESNKLKNKKIKAHCPNPSIDERWKQSRPARHTAHTSSVDPKVLSGLITENAI